MQDAVFVFDAVLLLDTDWLLLTELEGVVELD